MIFWTPTVLCALQFNIINYLHYNVVFIHVLFFTQIELKHTKLLIALKIVWYDDSRAKPNEFTLNLKIEKTDIIEPAVILNKISPR